MNFNVVNEIFKKAANFSYTKLNEMTSKIKVFVHIVDSTNYAAWDNFHRKFLAILNKR